MHTVFLAHHTLHGGLVGKLVGQSAASGSRKGAVNHPVGLLSTVQAAWTLAILPVHEVANDGTQ